jgi:hypothetical protein
MSMPHHHQAVHLDIGMIIHGVEEAQDRSRVDLLIGRRATWQRSSHDASLGHDETGERVRADARYCSELAGLSGGGPDPVPGAGRSRPRSSTSGTNSSR